MRGVERFELSYKVRFLTYAASWIDVHMQEHLHKLGIVHVPSHTRKAMNKQRKQENQLGSYAPQASTAMREPTTTTLDDVDAPADDDTEQAAQHSECNLFEYMEQADLTRCERLVLIYYFGLRGTEMEADELVQFFYELDGSLFNANQISRMASEAMLKLKTLLHEKGVTTLNDVL
jgi:DNA-directed RNA polymerase sigma subunit (sigma70/sigma32)